MISQEEYQARRKALACRLPKDSIALIPAAKEILRNGDAHYRFRQDSYFYYLTGFNEPEALLVITSENQTLLFNRPRDPLQEQWVGKRLGQEGALTELKMDKAFAYSELGAQLPSLLVGKSAVYYTLTRHLELDELLLQSINKAKQQVRRGVKAPEALCDLEPLLSEMRLFKSEAEIKLMRHAAQISVDAHKRAMRLCSQLKYEYQLEAELIHELGRQGCRNLAYDPIIGGGENACVLHYTDNNKPLPAGELVLIDAGGEYEGYAADITRTFPINGRFTPDQRRIYDLVLKAQKAGIAAIKPGLPWYGVQQIILRILTEGLCQLGLLQGELDDLLAQEAYKPFYMHQSGHWLGLDVHDCGVYKINNEWRPFEPGMVLTVEPGLYIKAGMEGVDRRWWGIGVRIEDDVLVTPTGHDVLTASLPVDAELIEALMRGD